MMRAAAVALALALTSCGSKPATPVVTTPERTAGKTVADRILPLFPDGAQVIIELDLVRLRENPVIGGLVTTALTGEGLAGIPDDVPLSPLAKANAIVLASYALGTSQAATVTVIATPEDLAKLPGAIRLGDGMYVLGPTEWTAQIEARAALAGIAETGSGPPLVASPDLLALRDHAMPPNAPGASLRITARLSFDARVALARQTGLDSAPAQVSIWADVVDDFAIIVDADAADPGDKKAKDPTKRLEAGMRGVLAGLAEDPAIRALGIPASLERAKLVARGTWVRTIVAIGPAHLQRVVERANAYIKGKS